MATAWIDPTPAPSDRPDTPFLSAEQTTSWRAHGFTLVDGLLPNELLAAARRDALDHYGHNAAPERADFGSGGRFTFPSDSEAANTITLHPRLLGAAAQLLRCETRDLRLTQSDVWAKRAHTDGGPLDNADQRIHVDYPNHSLTHPPRWDAPEAVSIIVYLSDVEVCGGATALVPRNGPDDPAYPWPITATPGVGELEWINDRERAEQYLERAAPDIARWRAEHLYPREQFARFHEGTILFYRQDTWHRGTPIAPGQLRIVQNLTFRHSRSTWISTVHEGWAWAMYRPSRVAERIVAGASVEQRCVLGFPAPDDAYWTAETVDAVEARYRPHGIDMTPYRAAL